MRLFTTPSTSVAAERGFSTMNLINNKLRSRLVNERVNQLCYISINSRVLDAPHKQIFRLDEAELEQIERDLRYLQDYDFEDIEALSDQAINSLFRAPEGVTTYSATGHTVSRVTGRGHGQLEHSRYETGSPAASPG